MPTHRWINQSQPQTLQSAVLLLYLNAALALLFGLLAGGAQGAIGIVTLAGVAGGYGIANEKKWGYYVAIVVAAIPLLYDVLGFLNLGYSLAFSSNFVIRVLFDILLAVLLLHPMSRGYQKIWFK